MKAKSSGISLSDKDAALVKGMIARGDRQHDIAAWFGVNGGRIGEISGQKSFAHVAAETNPAKLPPQGPYISGKKSLETENALKKLRDDMATMVAKIDSLLSKP